MAGKEWTPEKFHDGSLELHRGYHLFVRGIREMVSLIRDIDDGMGKKRKEIGAADMIRGRSWRGVWLHYITRTLICQINFSTLFSKSFRTISKERCQFSFQNFRARNISNFHFKNRLKIASNGRTIPFHWSFGSTRCCG